MGLRSGANKFVSFSRDFAKQAYEGDYLGGGYLLKKMEGGMRGVPSYVRSKLLDLGGGVPREIWEACEEARMEDDQARAVAQSEVKKIGDELCDRVSQVAVLQTDLQTVTARARYFEGKYQEFQDERRRLVARNAVLEDRNGKLVSIAKMARVGRIRAQVEGKKPYAIAFEQWKRDYAEPLEEELLDERRLSRMSVGGAVIGAMEILFRTVPDVQNAPVLYYDFVGNRGISTRAASELLGIDQEKLKNFRLAELLRGLSKGSVEEVRDAVKHSFALQHFSAQTYDGRDLFLSTYPLSQRVRLGRPPRRIGMGILLYHPEFKQNRVGWVMKTARVSRRVAKNVQEYFSALEEYFSRLARMGVEPAT